MRNLERHVRLVLRVVAIGLVAVGSVPASSWFEMPLHATAVGSPIRISDSIAGQPEAVDGLHQMAQASLGSSAIARTRV